MFKKLLLLLSLSVTPAVAVSAQSTNGSSIEHDFIAPDSPRYRLGDYDVTVLSHDSYSNVSRIEVIVPHYVFEHLSDYDNVYIAIPRYKYSSNYNLNMRIDLFDGQGYFDTAFSNLDYIPLSKIMCATLGYTVTDNPPYYYNLFDPALWDYNYLSYEIRLSFNVPTDIVIGPPNFMKEITLFTKLSYAGYSDGFIDGWSDGYAEGISEGIRQAEGTWLGNLIFGTVGSVVGFIFAISDFEVLGVSIMSIITLFVAIGVIMLFIKLIKGTN